jgi:hypothetical protein
LDIAAEAYRAFWWLKVTVVMTGFGLAAWSGFRPREGDSRKWYDRAIRSIGGLILLVTMLLGLILKLYQGE